MKPTHVFKYSEDEKFSGTVNFAEKLEYSSRKLNTRVFYFLKTMMKIYIEHHLEHSFMSCDSRENYIYCFKQWDSPYSACVDNSNYHYKNTESGLLLSKLY